MAAVCCQVWKTPQCPVQWVNSLCRKSLAGTLLFVFLCWCCSCNRFVYCIFHLPLLFWHFGIFSFSSCVLFVCACFGDSLSFSLHKQEERFSMRSEDMAICTGGTHSVQGNVLVSLIIWCTITLKYQFDSVQNRWLFKRKETSHLIVIEARLGGWYG